MNIMLNSGEVYQGDCLEVMKDIDDKSIDGIFTDLPYGSTKCKWDTRIPFDDLWTQFNRIIKKGRAIVLFGSQPFTSALVMSNPKMFKYEWIWGKGRGTGFQVSRYKPLVSHENILVFGSGAIVYNPQMREREKSRISKNKGTTRQMLISNGKEYNAPKALDKRFPITEILFPNNNQKGKINPTQKPVALLEYLIRTYTNENDLILDSTAGSCTTAIAAINTNRRWICIEKDKEQVDAGRDRIRKHLESRTQ